MEKATIYKELLNLPNLEITAVKIEGQKIIVECHVKNEVTECPCPTCHKPTSAVHQRSIREVRDLDISGREVWLQINTRQFVCRDCHRYFYEPLSFADSHKSYTHRQAKYIFLLAQKQSASEVGCIVNMVPKTVERLVINECKK